MSGMAPAHEDLFERTLAYPDPDAQARLARLVGVDVQRERLAKILGLMVNSDRLTEWKKHHHPEAHALLSSVLRRPPLVVLAGDVGSGKTELAETVGDAVARQERLPITLFPLSLTTRGQGRVGEMTRLLSAAFEHVHNEAAKLGGRRGHVRGGIILLVDEADALAQSREAAQMHHEDRAGVNAFIRGVDRLASAAIPAAVIMCTNRLSALDPAVRRRAADVLTFHRPDTEQRRRVLGEALAPLGFSPPQVDRLVALTGPRDGREYGCSYSDLVQRLLPGIVLDAYPTRPVTPARAEAIANDLVPTPPFREVAA